MNEYSKYLFLLVVLISLQSCIGYHYISSPQFVPLHEKKGELKINLSYKCFQVGYSISNKLSLFSTYNYLYGYSTTPSFWNLFNARSNTYRTSDFNFGVCYFKKYNFLKLEILVGSGFGKMSYTNDYESYPYNYFSLKADKINYFIQPDLSCKLIENDVVVDLGIFTKFIYTQYHNIKTSSFVSSYAKVDFDKDYFKNKNSINLFFIEPGFIFRCGVKNVKVQLIVSPTISLNNSHIKYKSFNLFFGLFFDFDSETIKNIWT